MNILLHDEILWIERNQHRYDSPTHAKAVIGNIEKRYWIAEAKKRIALFQKTKTTGDQLGMFELLNTH